VQNTKHPAARRFILNDTMRSRRSRRAYRGTGPSSATAAPLASAWVNFAKTGDPANQFIPNWPRFESKHRSTMVFGERTRAVNDAYGEIGAFWLDMPGPSSLLG